MLDQNYKADRAVILSVAFAVVVLLLMIWVL